MKKGAIITFEDFHGRKDIGSSRIRGKWIADQWGDGVEIYKPGGDYSFVIFQKVYWWQYAEKFRGIKILDMCDPDFLHFGYPIKRTIESCDAVTCSTEEMARAVADFAGGKPVVVIPDCVLEPEKLPQKKHVGKLQTLVWFGYQENFPMLDAAIPAIIKRDLELIVISQKPYRANTVGKGKLKLTNLPWSANTWQQDLLKADVVINPRSTHGRFKYKSDNKTVQAWAMGIPVAHNDKELDLFIEADARNKEGAERRAWVIENRDVRVAVKQYQELINVLTNEKEGKI